MAFDSKPTKTKKQLKEEKKEFPSLIDDEPSLLDEPKEESKNDAGLPLGGGGRKGKRKGKNKDQGETIKLGFF